MTSHDFIQDSQYLRTHALGKMGYRCLVHHNHYARMVHEHLPTKPYVLFLLGLVHLD